MTVVYLRHVTYGTMLLVLQFIFTIHFQHRKRFRYRFPTSMILYYLIVFFTPDYLYIESIPVNTLLILLSLVLGAKFVFCVSWKTALFCSISSSLLQHIVSQLYQMAAPLILGHPLDPDWAGVFFMQGLDAALIWGVIFTIACTTGYYLFARQNKDGKEAEIKDGKLIIEAGCILAVVYLVGEWYNVRGGDSSLTNLVTAICGFALLDALHTSNKVSRLEIEDHIMRQLFLEEQAHYENLVSNIDVINRKCHDLKYQIAELQDMTSNEEKRRQLQQLQKDVVIYENLARTGNAALDNTLSEKILLCESKQIHFEYRVDGRYFDFMEALDIYILFGNALDNAIESAQRQEEPAKRFILMDIFVKEHILKVHMENNCEEDIVFKNGVPQTSKPDKLYHGYGIESMRHIVEKYKGHLVVYQKGRSFFTDMLFPITDRPVI